MLAASFSEAVRTRLELSKQEKPAFHAEMAAHSALQFALKQLSMDPDWRGTAGEITPGDPDQGAFRVLLSQEQPDSGELSLVLEGRSLAATVQLEATMRLSDSGPDPLSQYAIAILGEDVYLHDLEVEGNVLIMDSGDAELFAYHPHPDGWEEDGEWMQAPRAPNEFRFDDLEIEDGALHKYMEGDYSRVDGDQVTVNYDIHAPSYNMAPYLEPGPNVVHLYDKRRIRNEVIDETVVVFNEAGTSLTLIESQLKGGLVMYVDPSYDPQVGPLYNLTMKGRSSIGGGSGGVHPHLALLAPGAQIRAPGCAHEPALTGLSYVNALNEFHVATVHGQLIIQNWADTLGYSQFHYNASMTEDPPPGLGYHSGDDGSLQLLALRETYDPQPVAPPNP